MSRTTLAARMRVRRSNREFERTLSSASPAMRQELLAAAARTQIRLI